MDILLNQVFNIEEIIEIVRKTDVIDFKWGVLFERCCEESIGKRVNWL